MSDLPIRLMLVDDHTTLVLALTFVFNREPDFAVVAQAGTLAEARRQLAAGIGVDVALVDLDLPDGSGLELIRDLSTANPEAYTVVLSGFVDARTRAFAVEAGASAVLPKTTDIAEVVNAVRRLFAGEAVISPAEAVALLRQASRLREQERAAAAGMGRLTAREREVLQALADGLSDKAIAARLGIGERTVRVHMVNLLAKLGVESRLQALVLAVRHGAVRIG